MEDEIATSLSTFFEGAGCSKGKLLPSSAQLHLCPHRRVFEPGFTKVLTHHDSTVEQLCKPNIDYALKLVESCLSTSSPILLLCKPSKKHLDGKKKRR
jgi:hypothetical protein